MEGAVRRSNGLRVAGGMEDRSGQLQLAAEPCGVAEIPVVGQGHVSLLVIDLDGLAVPAAGGPGGTIAGMAHRHGPPGKPFQNIAAEHLAYQS